MTSTPEAGGAVAPATVALRLDVSGPLADAMTNSGAVELVRAEVARHVQAIADSLGIPTTVVATVATDPGPAMLAPGTTVADVGMRLWAGGTALRFPRTLPSRVIAVMTGNQPMPGAPVIDEGWLAGRASTDVAELHRAACVRKPSRRRPDVLIDAQAVVAWAASVTAEEPALAGVVDDLEWIGAILGHLVAFGIGISERTRISKLLEECENVPVHHAGELLLAALSKDTVGVRVPAGLANDIGVLDFDDDEDQLASVARTLLSETGLVVPPIEVVPTLAERETISLRVNDLETLAQPLLDPDTCLVNGATDAISFIVPDALPAAIPGSDAAGATVGATHREALESAGYTVWDRTEHTVFVLATEAPRSRRVLRAPGSRHRAAGGARTTGAGGRPRSTRTARTAGSDAADSSARPRPCSPESSPGRARADR